jgi:peptidoglycan/LPS O-acetylase OafA/YrhL
MPSRLRLGILIGGTIVVPPLTEPSSIASGLGALLYEGCRHVTLQQAIAWLGRKRRIGEARGCIHVFAATLLIVGVMLSPTAARPFTLRPLLWLGRVSFGLYLVHVPILYTLVATIYLTYAVASPILLVIFIIVSLLVAELFMRLVDEPTLRLSRRVRKFTSSGGCHADNRSSSRRR